jgi:glycine dehydrogenase
VLRNITENPGWYTSYTPYQAEISQGRLESLLHFQTLIAELTGLPWANASLLDEATAAAEAMYLSNAFHNGKRVDFYIDHDVFPFIKEVVKTRARMINVQVSNLKIDLTFKFNR